MEHGHGLPSSSFERAQSTGVEAGAGDGSATAPSQEGSRDTVSFQSGRLHSVRGGKQMHACV